MLALARDVNPLYPELIRAGGLVNALQVALRESGSPYTVSERIVNVGVVCARLEGEERRRCQVYIVEQRRLFVFDLWTRDSILVAATAGSMIDVARRTHKWLAATYSASDVVAGLERVSVRDDGMAYDAREEVDQAWREVSHVDPSLLGFLREASKREKLRQLFPFGGNHCFGFSRCTRFPFTDDIPLVKASGAGQFAVVDRSWMILGRGNAASAADLVVALLPPNCGPAVSGTCDAFGPRER